MQRLDGPVRGNGAGVVQELKTLFAGAGWNVIRVQWGSNSGRWLFLRAGWILKAHGRGGGRRVRKLRHRWPLQHPGSQRRWLSRTGGAGHNMSDQTSKRAQLPGSPFQPGVCGLCRGGGLSRPADGDPAQTTRLWHRCLHDRVPTPRARPKKLARGPRPLLGAGLPLSDQDPGKLRYPSRRGQRRGCATSGASRRASATMCRRGASRRVRSLIEARYLWPSTPIQGDRSISHHRRPWCGCSNKLMRDSQLGRTHCRSVTEWAHLRHLGHVPPVRHLLALGPELPRGQRPARLLPRKDIKGPDS